MVKAWNFLCTIEASRIDVAILHEFHEIKCILFITGINTKNHVEENQYRAMVNLCLELKINCSELLTRDVRSHPEFITALANIATSSKEYRRVVKMWREHQSFVKKE